MSLADRDYMSEHIGNRLKSNANQGPSSLWAFLPVVFLIAAVFFAIQGKSFWSVIPWLMAALGLSFITQRYIFGRSWHAIMWGDKSGRRFTGNQNQTTSQTRVAVLIVAGVAFLFGLAYSNEPAKMPRSEPAGRHNQ